MARDEPLKKTLNVLSNQSELNRRAIDAQSKAIEELRASHQALLKLEAAQGTELASIRGGSDQHTNAPSPFAWIAPAISVIGALVTIGVAIWNFRNLIDWDTKKLRYQVFVAEQDRRLDILRRVPTLISQAQVAASTYVGQEQAMSRFIESKWLGGEEQATRRNQTQSAYLSAASNLEEALQPYGSLPDSVESEERDLGKWGAKQLFDMYDLLRKEGQELNEASATNYHEDRQSKFRAFEQFVAAVRKSEEAELLTRGPATDNLTPYRA